LGFPDGKLDALDIKNGRLIWQKSIAFASGGSDIDSVIDISADPLVDGNVVYLASYQNFVGAMSLNTGELLWKHRASVYKNMLLADNRLYVTDSQDILWALDKSTGKVLWKQNALKARGLTSPVLFDKNLAFADKTGYLHLVDAKTGILLTRYEHLGGVNVAPKVLGNSLYVLTNKGILNKLSVA